MIDIRRFDSLGAFRTDWLNARHHFSFGQYHDPARMGWGALRVWNDDEIQPHTGFAPHPHKDMEIITYVREGAITHSDSMGNEGRTRAGDVQVMSAGAGVRHSEYNREDVLTRLFQIWILPDEPGGAPFWDARAFPKGEQFSGFTVLASGRDGDEDALPIRADARVLGASLKDEETASYTLEPGRRAYLTVSKGQADVNGAALNARDAAAITDERAITVTASGDAELVLVDTR